MTLTHPDQVSNGMATATSLLADTGTGTSPAVLPLTYYARTEDAKKATTELIKDDVLGVVIVGDSGVGKSALANAIATILSTSHHTVHLRNPRAGAVSPYSCLTPLLARLPGRTMDSPTDVLHAVAQLLQEDAKGAPVVILLENAEALDEMSTGVLMQLILMRRAKVVAICRHVGDLPPDFHWLLGDGQFTEMALRNYDRKQSHMTLEALLGGDVTATSSAVLHQISGGNPMLLESLVHEQHRRGAFCLQNGVWVLKDNVSYASGSRFEDPYRARWAAKSPIERSIVELLAVAGRVRLRVLGNLFSPEALFGLEERGTILVESAAPHWVHLREPFFGTVVLGWMTPSRRRELYNQLMGELTRAGDWDRDAGADRLNDAIWALECGVELNASVALRGAWAGIERYEPLQAARLAATVDVQDPLWPCAHTVLAAVELMEFRPAEALRILREVGDAASTMPPVERARYVALTALALRDTNSAEGTSALLRYAREAVNADPSAAADDIESANEILALSELDEALFEGSFAAVVARAEKAYYGQAGSRDYRLACGARLVDAYAFTGREDQACALGSKLSHLLHGSDASPLILEVFTGSYYRALLISGRWIEAVELMQQALDTNLGRIAYRGATSEVGIGLAYVYAGRGALAVPPLKSALSQMELRPSGCSSAVVHAALAFAYAQCSNADQARLHLAKLERERSTLRSWVDNNVIDFCSAMAKRWLGDASGKAELLASAATDEAAHRYTTAGVSLFGATVSGTNEEFRHMRDIAQHRQGTLAKVSELTARGCLELSAPLLLEAAELAAGLSLDAVQARCARLALDFARRLGDRRSAQAALAIVEQLRTDVPGLPAARTPAVQILTSREREIVRLAATGQSNREIATELGVTIRTVEGHLYQAFAKLQVTSRTELSGLL